MSTSLLDTTPTPTARSFAARFPIYYGWVNLFVAVLASVSTLPGRSWGLGLITEQLLTDFHLDRVRYAEMNLWATLIGAVFCWPTGWLLDRIGARIMVAVVMGGLGVVVIAMSQAATADELFVMITLTRGLGQSALSVISLALISKWFSRRMSSAMAMYMVGVLFAFATAEWAIGTAAEAQGWRATWAGTGWVLLAVAMPLGWLLARSTPESCGVQPDVAPEETEKEVSLTLMQALMTWAFWVFAAALVLNSVTQAGISLFGISLVKDRGLGTDAYKTMLVASTVGALLGTLIAWIGARWFAPKRMIALGLVVLLATLVSLPVVQTRMQLYIDGFLWGASIGLLGVAGNAAWRQAFGRAHIGSIQGAAGICHVLSSAAGPLLMVKCQQATGSYSVFFNIAGAALAVVALATWFLPMPSRK